MEEIVYLRGTERDVNDLQEAVNNSSLQNDLFEADPDGGDAQVVIDVTEPEDEQNIEEELAAQGVRRDIITTA